MFFIDGTLDLAVLERGSQTFGVHQQALPLRLGLPVCAAWDKFNLIERAMNLIAGLTELLPLAGGPEIIRFRKNPRARRYVLRLDPEGRPWVTIPRGGSLAEARQFATRNARWLTKRLENFRASAQAACSQTSLLFRGVPTDIITDSTARHTFAGEPLKPTDNLAEARHEARVWLFGCARRELPPRVMELAARHGVTVQAISIRNQRSRWGSCSARGRISLNWRLIQTPEMVRDYIIVHELMHLREMNHSARFWRHVREAFPQMEEAEAWLKQNARLLREA